MLIEFQWGPHQIALKARRIRSCDSQVDAYVSHGNCENFLFFRFISISRLLYLHGLMRCEIQFSHLPNYFSALTLLFSIRRFCLFFSRKRYKSLMILILLRKNELKTQTENKTQMLSFARERKKKETLRQSLAGIGAFKAPV